MYRKEYIQFYGFLGIGQFGGNITRKFEEAGFSCVVANSSEEDLFTLRNAKNKFHFRNGRGCHKNRKKAKQLLRENLEALIDEIRSKMPAITTLFVCASAAGGTGSGMLASVVKVLNQVFDFNICIITVLPSKSENFQSYANTVELFQELSKLEKVGAMFILDNSKNNDKLKINEIFFTHLNTLLANNNGGDYGCLDRGEIDKLLSTSGMSTIAVLNKDNGDMMSDVLTSANIYAPLENNKVVRYIGYMCSGKSAKLEEIYSQVGIPIDTYIGTDASNHVCVLAGLSLPKTRLNEIKSMAETNVEIIKKHMESEKEDLFGDSVGFLTAFDDEEKPVKKEKVSSLDILNSLL